MNIAMSFVARQVLLVVMTIATLFHCYSACFVRNCPVGGKRSALVPSRECLRCGEGDLGVCLSSSVCCLPYVGCLSDEAAVDRCSLENKLPWPCAMKGHYCGQNGSGVCVVDGVCCTGDHRSDCFVTNECL